MTGLAVTVSDNNIRHSSLRLSTKNAWAKYVRNRWRTNTLCAIQDEWDLTAGEARGVLYAQASQPTIDKILHHPRGGFRLGLTILEIMTQTALDTFLRAERERLSRERAEYDAQIARVAQMAGDHAAVASVASPGPAERLGPSGEQGGERPAEHGGRAALEPRRFDEGSR